MLAKRTSTRASVPLLNAVLILYLAAVWPETVRCAAAVSDTQRAQDLRVQSAQRAAHTSAFHLLPLQSRLTGTGSSSSVSAQIRKHGLCGMRAFHIASAKNSGISAARGSPRPSVAGTSMQQKSQLPGGGPGGIFKKIEQTLMLVKSFVQQNLGSGLALPALLLVMWSSGQFQWLFSIFNFIFVLVIVVPTALVVGLNLWVKSSVVDGACPNCQSRVMLPKNQQSACMTCGTSLLCTDGRIERASIYNTREDAATGKTSVVDVYDVEAIDIDAK